MSAEFYRPMYETDAGYYDGAHGRRHRNGHVLEMQDVEWRCLHCGHWFDAEADADAFGCGDPCSAAHCNRADVLPGMWESADLMGGSTDVGDCTCAAILPAGAAIQPCPLDGYLGDAH